MNEECCDKPRGFVGGVCDFCGGIVQPVATTKPKTITKSYGKGIEILPHDQGTFLVQSRTNREDYYLVDLTEDPATCTCPSYQFRKECFHIRYLCKLLGVETPKPTANNQLIAA